VGKSFGINIEKSAKVLEKYEQPAGRLRLIKGINNTKILDDTYNAAPSSTIAAIDALVSVPGNRKLIVFGEMAELGKLSEKGHREVGDKVVESKADLVFLVGQSSKWTEDQMRRNNFPGKIFF